MTKFEQASKLVAAVYAFNHALKEPDVRQDTYGIQQPMIIHLDSATFVEVQKLTKLEPVLDYQHAAVHAKIEVGDFHFVWCQNLL